MGEWVLGAAINVVGSIGINLGTNLLKLGHNQSQRERTREGAVDGKAAPGKSVAHFPAWRTGLVVFFFGNCLNFVSFGYAAQSLLSALGSVQFISNVAFAYFVLEEVVNHRILLATAFIVCGNAFLVAYGNHQSAVFTPQQLLSNYKNHVYLAYCVGLVLIVGVHHALYRRGRHLLLAANTGDAGNKYWDVLLPFCYAVVSGAVGTHSVLFAKSLSILLRLTLNGESQLYGWFTYLILSLFFLTAVIWMARLNEGLSMFDAILIVPMLQISWTTFSIFTGFIYFQEYKVFDSFRAYMFAVGMLALFFGIVLLAPQQGASSSSGNGDASGVERSERLESSLIGQQSATTERKNSIVKDASRLVGRAKTACMGFGDGHLSASSIFSMPMLSSSRSSWRNPMVHWQGHDDDDAELQVLI